MAARRLIPIRSPPSIRTGEPTPCHDALLARLAACLASAALLGAAALPAAAQTKTLKVVAHADVKILDPTFTTAYITRNFGYMVYDMPFGLDEKGQPKPQMVDKWTTSKDGKLWTFTLRPEPQVLRRHAR